MADLYAASKKPMSLYKDRRYGGDLKERELKLKHTTTLYVGNLSFYTREEQIFDLFSRVGEVKRIIMGLDRLKKTPCGFCFVEYFTRPDAEKSVHFLSGMKLDERTIRVDYDVGYTPGRQYGRGRSGGQVRDEYRADYDPGRGGYGKNAPQTGMSGMELWSGQGQLPPGPAPIHHFPPPPGFPMGGMRGRGFRGGRGRFRGGRGRGFGGPGPGPGPRYIEQGSMGEGGFGGGRGMKRRREFDGGYGGPGGDEYPSFKRSRGENGNGMHIGPPGMGREGEMHMDRKRDGEDGMNGGGEPVRNARFDRGKKDDADDA